jgi:hypothetical protein
MGDHAVSTAQARQLPLPAAAQRRPEGAESLESVTGLSRREANLRSAATTCLAGIALVQAIELPSLYAEGRQFAFLGVMAGLIAIGLAVAFAAASEAAGRHLWRLTAGLSFLVVVGWIVPRVWLIPGATHHQGHWVASPGAAAAVMGLAGLVLAVVAIRPGRASVRGLLTGAAVLLAFTPGIGALLVALGPGLSGGLTSLAAGHHAHHGLDETLIKFQPIAGGKGGHYVYEASVPPHQTAIGIALIVIAALVFTYGLLGFLRRRAASGASDQLIDGTTERGVA